MEKEKEGLVAGPGGAHDVGDCAEFVELGGSGGVGRLLDLLWFLLSALLLFTFVVVGEPEETPLRQS